MSNIQCRAARLAIIYSKSLQEVYAAMSRYASERPCTWNDINWKGINLSAYFLKADNVAESR
ncbi:MAG TPA: hypothetical protein V6C63_21190 [Allocoleopsis sp.]